MLVYEASVAEDPDEDKHHPSQNITLPTVEQHPSPPMPELLLTPRDKPPSDSSLGWEIVGLTSEGKGGTVYEVGPLKSIEILDSAV